MALILSLQDLVILLDLNSVKNVDMDDKGGQWATSILNEEFDEVIIKPTHSNVKKAGEDTKV